MPGRTTCSAIATLYEPATPVVKEASESDEQFRVPANSCALWPHSGTDAVEGPEESDVSGVGKNELYPRNEVCDAELVRVGYG